jgi:acetyl esterase
MRVLDQDVAALLAWQAEHPGPSIANDGLDASRAAYDAAAALLDPDAPDVDDLADVELAGAAGPLPGMLVTPRQVRRADELLVWVHGGGWAQGSITSHERAVRRLATVSETRVLGISYRLAPEFQFPAQIEDVEAIVASLPASSINVDPSRIALGGDSAGANLVLVAGMELARAGSAPLFEILLYPCLGPEMKTDSSHDLGEGYGLTTAQMDAFYAMYLGDNPNHADPRISPLLTPDLHDAPPTILTVCGFDPLRDEGLALAGLLEQCGVDVELFDESSLTHGYLRMSGVARACREAVERVGRAIANRFGATS